MPTTVAPTKNPASAARELRKEAWNTSGNKVRFPIDPYVIADRVGVKVITTALPSDTAGFIRKDPITGVVSAYLNSLDGQQRRRFTLSHELGHFMHHRNAKSLSFAENRNDLASSGTDVHEIFANRFAAELLMPGQIIKKLWAQGEDPESIRRRVDVSKPAFANRLKSLGLL